MFHESLINIQNNWFQSSFDADSGGHFRTHEVPWHDEPESGSGEDGESSEDDESSGEVAGESGDER